MQKIILLLLSVSTLFAFSIKSYKKDYYFFSNSKIKIIFKIELDSINEELKIRKKQFPHDAVLLDVENCKSCRGRLYNLIFLWDPLPYEVGFFHPIIIINDKKKIDFNLTVVQKEE